MNKKTILATIEQVLVNYSNQGVDLSLSESRKKIAMEILNGISKKVYMISYDSQESFE